MIKKQLTRLDKTAPPGPAPPQALEAQPLQSQVEALKEEMVQLGPVQEEEVDVVVRRQPGRLACANIKESQAQALKELPDGFYVCEAGRSKAIRLHKLGYCWMVPRVDYSAYSYKGPLMPREQRESVQALQRSLVHTNATRQGLRLGSVHGHRLRYGCHLLCVVQSSVQPLQPPPPTPSSGLFLFPLRSLLDVSAMIKVVPPCRWIFCLVVSRPFGYDQSEYLFILGGSFCGALSAFLAMNRWYLLFRVELVLARRHA